MREPVNELDFEEAELFGKSVLFSGCRLERDSVPEGLRLYELQHDDADDMSPCWIAESVSVNFYGSILTSCPVQLFADGGLDLLREDFGYADNEMTVSEYLAKCPPKNADVMELSPFRDGTQSLFFTGSAKEDKDRRCVGHLRGDFGDNGEGFYSTWWGTANRSLNAPAFKNDLTRVMAWLREDRSGGPLPSVEFPYDGAFLRPPRMREASRRTSRRLRIRRGHKEVSVQTPLRSAQGGV